MFTNLVETDQVYGHRQDVEGFHGALREIDAAVGRWLERLDPARDLLVLTADHGCDPTTPGTDHTREHVPLLAAFDGHGGRRHDGPFADVGASVLRWLAGRDAPELPGRRRSCREARRGRWPSLRRAWRGCGGSAAATTGPDGSRRARHADADAADAPRSSSAALLAAPRPRAAGRQRRAATPPPRPARQRARDRADARNARGLRAARRHAACRATIDVEGAAPCCGSAPATAIAGVRGRFEAERALRARRAPARGWRIRSQTSRRQRHPWEVARVRGAPQPALRDPRARPALAVDGLPEALEDGYARMRDVLAAGALRRRYLVVVAGDAAQARQMTTGIRGVATLAAISDTAGPRGGAGRARRRRSPRSGCSSSGRRSRRSTPTAAAASSRTS